MITNVILALAALAILKTLWLQKKATQASMFSDIAGRISSLLGETPRKNGDITEQYNWIVRLLNELEALVFLARQKLLAKKMEEYYREFIIGWMDDLPKKYPDAIKDIPKAQVGAYQELKEYYKAIKKTEAPCFNQK